MSYRDRQAAGAVLADALSEYVGRPDVAVLGLVRGGLPVAAEVARRLNAPLDALVVRKLGVPWSPEVAFGAVGPHDVYVLNEDIASRLSEQAVAVTLERESMELSRREQRYRAGRPPLELTGLVVLLVDDGLATGATARAAVAVARLLGARRVVVAVPVGSPLAVNQLREVADEVVCPVQPRDFDAVSRWYDDFDQVTDSEVVALLAAA
jgi:putative phosphoribosyl transferase